VFLNHLTAQEISRRLALAQKNGSAEPSPEFPRMHELLPGKPRPAAVLIPLLQKEGEWHLLFTRRNANLPEHSGQVAFPGGRSDPGDTSPEMTALRESHEEIGLNPQDVHLLGRLHDFITITNYQVTPVVGVIPWPYEFHLQVHEVSRVFTIPLSWLAEISNSEEHWRQLPAPYDPVPVVYYKEYDGEVLWGASARFTQTFIRNILE
jgi:8-oxo-dGTP pyrophosphatase MutT (NUDIX family)